MQIDIDEESVGRHLTKRERIGIKLVLLLIGMTWPAKYKHQLEVFLKSIEEELK